MEFLKQVMAATLAVAIGSIPAAAQQQSNITLRVASFAGPFGEGLQKYSGDLFTKRTGIKIEYIYGNPADHLAKMIASRGGAVRSGSNGRRCQFACGCGRRAWAD